MKTLLIFIPSQLYKEKPGQMIGKIVYDEINDVKKFYIIGRKTSLQIKNKTEIIGYYFGTCVNNEWSDKKYSNWINLYVKSASDDNQQNYDYCLKNIFINGTNISPITCHVMIIIYDQLSLIKSELFVSSTTKDHFIELQQLLKKKENQNEIRKKTMIDCTREFILTNFALVLFYPILFLCTVSKFLLPIFKYSTLGLHWNGWLQNFNWMLNSIIHKKRITIKTGNYILAMIVDMILGILMLRFILISIEDVAPSSVMLTNADKVVVTLKQLINWLMGSPAGLKLNSCFNEVLGKFFLYHIHLWWTFLTITKPVMDFAFEVVLLFGRLGLTFQIAIIADLLALLSFHSYCIYVYAARLFNIQLRGLTSLFRLFLGKKKNPLRERVDSCEYQPDQLFLGTLLFTILLFLIPTTWVYYSVFTTLRLIMIGLGGTLIRLKFYLQVIPIYTFVNWIFRVDSAV
ncbi:uncharacterized protein LOC127289862 isoform X2 [Leptopilina boulardi]|uniref:uncharacterized protein LOC127289862 isoform X2 n=1 Tax=Leptopilina boulardi TaxID=63433 RepID=UPI0021F67FD7|nr:uncharacterized protein LOC127289862 isoform X2 [Leptopilina boulardi]